MEPNHPANCQVLQYGFPKTKGLKYHPTWWYFNPLTFTFLLFNTISQFAAKLTPSKNEYLHLIDPWLRQRHDPDSLCLSVLRIPATS